MGRAWGWNTLRLSVENVFIGYWKALIDSAWNELKSDRRTFKLRTFLAAYGLQPGPQLQLRTASIFDIKFRIDSLGYKRTENAWECLLTEIPVNPLEPIKGEIDDLSTTFDAQAYASPALEVWEPSSDTGSELWVRPSSTDSR